MLPVNQDIFEEWVGPPVDVKPIYSCKTLHDSGGIAFELYKEACRVVCFAAHLLDEAAAAQGGFARNQAICAGLMVKISKFMLAVIQLSTGDDRGEIVLALGRIIMESAISLEFLVRSTDDKYFDQFVDFSLGPERELYDQIQANIAARNGEIWPIEKRLLGSISYICTASGIKIEEVQRKHRDWAENVRERLKALGKEYLYATAYRMPSHAVHASWPDLFFGHLKYDETTRVFKPEAKWTRVGSRMLAPMAALVLESVDPYLERFLPVVTERDLLRVRIADLHDRLLEADRADEKLKCSLREKVDNSD
ncbi:MAG: DUF5677 domain-containing protein [Terriglobales bacterium]